MIEFKNKKNKNIVFQQRISKIQNLTIYFTSILSLFTLTLISFINLTPDNANYYANAGNLTLVIILTLLPIKRLLLPVKQDYGNYYIYASLIVLFVLYNEYFNSDVNLSSELIALGMTLSTLSTLIIITLPDKSQLSSSKRIVYNNIPHKR